MLLTIVICLDIWNSLSLHFSLSFSWPVGTNWEYLAIATFTMRIFGKVAIPENLLRSLLVCVALRVTIISAAGLETLREETRIFPPFGGKEGPCFSVSSLIHRILCSPSFRHFKFSF